MMIAIFQNSPAIQGSEFATHLWLHSNLDLLCGLIMNYIHLAIMNHDICSLHEESRFLCGRKDTLFYSGVTVILEWKCQNELLLSGSIFTIINKLHTFCGHIIILLCTFAMHIIWFREQSPKHATRSSPVDEVTLNANQMDLRPCSRTPCKLLASQLISLVFKIHQYFIRD